MRRVPGRARRTDSVCGRFTSKTDAADLAAYFGVDEVATGELGARYNVAPTDEVYAVAASRDGSSRRLGSFRWGLVPFWAKEPGVGARMINARAETLLTSSAFKRSFAGRRCIVPADGFYEWQVVPERKQKQPWYVSRRDGDVLAFAGLWDSWRPTRGSDEGRLVSCTIVTTEANGLVLPVHERMPAILPPGAWEAWLDPGNDDLDGLLRMLGPAPDELLALTPVRTLVNDVRNDGPDLVEPLPDDERDTLF
jgi:putative SOS response-associated peptidase YedK